MEIVDKTLKDCFKKSFKFSKEENFKFDSENGCECDLDIYKNIHSFPVVLCVKLERKTHIEGFEVENVLYLDNYLEKIKYELFAIIELDYSNYSLLIYQDNFWIRFDNKNKPHKSSILSSKAHILFFQKRDKGYLLIIINLIFSHY